MNASRLLTEYIYAYCISLKLHTQEEGTCSLDININYKYWEKGDANTLYLKAPAIHMLTL